MSHTFNKLTETHEDTILVVDSFNLAFRYLHSGKLSFLEEYIATVESLKKSYKAAKVIMACDSGSSSYRKNLLPTYKQGRKDKQETQSEADELKFLAFMKEFNRVIGHIREEGKYPVLKFEKCEADDIAAYIVRKYGKKYKIWLISTDKDWDLLISDNVSRFSYVTRKETTINNWDTHYEYSPEDHISIKCLTGDSGDSIPGVDGIGPKKAHALVKEYGSTYDIIASLPIQSRYKHIKTLNEFGAQNLILNYKLMDLVTHCDEALGLENCGIIDSTLERYLNAN
jgi:5'-3' exonuclease